MTDLNDFVVIENNKVAIMFDCRKGMPIVLYYGKRFSSATTPVMLAELGTRQEAKCAPVVEPPLSLMPIYGDGFTGSVGLEIHGSADVFACKPKLIRTQTSQHSCVFICEDAARGIRLEFEVALDQHCDIATWQTRLTNISDSDVHVVRCTAPTIPLANTYSKLKTFEGRWSSEFQTRDREIVMGSYVRENRRGKTSHDTFPGIIAFAKNTDEQQGACLGFHLATSGNHRLCVDHMIDDRQFVQMGELLYPGELTLAKGQSYASPVLYSGYSQCGFSGLSQQFHHYIRTNILRHSSPSKPRPVHYNTWEGLYFDHNMDTLLQLADKVASLGIERFVLDDGWFGERRSDKAGLGDWTVNREIYPDGLGPLISHVNSLGMEFGIWLEPEMVNPDSDLYRAHPDWVLGSEHNDEVPFRHQRVLDLTRPEVSAYLYECITSLLDEYPQIHYIKWDMNRDVNHQIGHTKKPAMHGQVQALYELIGRIKTRYRHIEIESCCSGGGRVDLGILQVTDRFWTSDSNDALDRLRIQRGFSFFFPPELMGAHVGPRDCHITGRNMSIETRAAVAMFGHMGIEMDPRELSEHEAKVLAQAIAFYKTHRHLFHSGNLIRLNEDGLNINFGYVDKTQDNAVFAYNSVYETIKTVPKRYIFEGLNADKSYQIEQVWPPELEEFSVSILQVIKGRMYTGEALMEVGLQMPVVFPETCLVFVLRSV